MECARYQFFTIDALNVASRLHEVEGIAHLAILLIGEMLAGVGIKGFVGSKMVVEVLLPHAVECGCMGDDELCRIVGRSGKILDDVPWTHDGNVVCTKIYRSQVVFALNRPLMTQGNDGVGRDVLFVVNELAARIVDNHCAALFDKIAYLVKQVVTGSIFL